MSDMLNLVSDPWIPVRHRDGTKVARPDQIADPDVLGPAWPRPDLNLACHELLIGLVYLACPPGDEDARLEPPDQVTLRNALAPLSPAFELLGEGPRFLQDFEPLEGEPNPPDMLFIDSAGGSTARKNADLMVRRDRYEALPLPLAAMALFTLQSFAPSGGAGNRTSMRGGGPLVTLVRPEGEGLWPLIWANVPYGAATRPNELSCLPWMRPTVTSNESQVVVPEGDPMDGPPPEMFFGQPRRLRLVADGDGVTGVIQRPYGTNYAHWVHDLSPYYVDAKGQKLPMHPRPGPFGYRNWRGIILQSDKRHRPKNLERHLAVPGAPRVDLIVAGWAMDNMKPLDFLWSEQPVFPLAPEAELSAIAMIEAAEQAAFALAVCVRDGMGESEAVTGAADAARQAFFDRTQQPFVDRVAALSNGASPDHGAWLAEMRRVALALFDEQVRPGLSELQETRRKGAVAARKSLLGAFTGHGGLAKKIYQALELKLPPQPTRKRKVE
ncbi:MAG: type I-E CRISPR-associated protein Cse1/CasA [Boseongicola sp.]|nr:type I-E CRISPR-associated protein Cse1/CasA [Boseongicola sp.]